MKTVLGPQAVSLYAPFIFAFKSREFYAIVHLGDSKQELKLKQISVEWACTISSMISCHLTNKYTVAQSSYRYLDITDDI